jgi:hypothetical protein
MLPEAAARLQIDALLQGAEWAVQSYKQVDCTAARGVALTEVPLRFWRYAYLLVANRQSVGIRGEEGRSDALHRGGAVGAVRGESARLPRRSRCTAVLLRGDWDSDVLLRQARPESRPRQVFVVLPPAGNTQRSRDAASAAPPGADRVVITLLTKVYDVTSRFFAEPVG